MSMINRAYSVLADPLKRARYDEKINIRPTERRGSGPVSNPAKPRAPKGRADLRRLRDTLEGPGANGAGLRGPWVRAVWQDSKQGRCRAVRSGEC